VEHVGSRDHLLFAGVEPVVARNQLLFEGGDQVVSGDHRTPTDTPRADRAQAPLVSPHAGEQVVVDARAPCDACARTGPT
jgi:hypothetical protein